LNSLEENLLNGGRTHAVILNANYLLALLEHAQQIGQQAVALHAQAYAQLGGNVRLHRIVSEERVQYVGEHDLVERIVLVNEQTKVLSVGFFQEERCSAALDFAVVHYGDSVAQHIRLFKVKYS